ncbi:hypothetical protein [Modicisalibacter xianhensis]|nr:hypothetical protein [Halomonas xianhensis]
MIERVRCDLIALVVTFAHDLGYLQYDDAVADRCPNFDSLTYLKVSRVA